MFASLLSRKSAPANAISMKARQAPLIESYAADPDSGWIVDSATTSPDDVSLDQPIHSQVVFGTGIPASQRIGVHTAVGGNCDYPNPGEMLSAALAGCLDTTVRIIANRLGLPLTHLKVTVDAHVDVRGTLRVDKQVPVGFQAIDVNVEIKSVPGVTDEQLSMLLKAAEHSCVVLQTLRNPPEIRFAPTTTTN